MTIKDLKAFIKDLPDENLVKATFQTGAILPAKVKFYKGWTPAEPDYILITAQIGVAVDWPNA